jgi:hypothetical protein
MGEAGAAFDRKAVSGGASGFVLALVVSAGILLQRTQGSEPRNAVMANVLATIAAIFAVLAIVRVMLTSFEGEGDAGAHQRRVEQAFRSQALGAVVGVVVAHGLLRVGLPSYPWLREAPSQLVNDLVGVFGILAFVWGCAHKPIRVQLMLGGLTLVGLYELTAGYWHLDAAHPVAHAWSIQQFVGGEVTASGIGVLTFRLLFASGA